VTALSSDVNDFLEEIKKEFGFTVPAPQLTFFNHDGLTEIDVGTHLLDWWRKTQDVLPSKSKLPELLRLSPQIQGYLHINTSLKTNNEATLDSLVAAIKDIQLRLDTSLTQQTLQYPPLIWNTLRLVALYVVTSPLRQSRMLLLLLSTPIYLDY
jgi:hypothetical protein